ncbi:MAG: LPS export ABC transporter periplasmic protein LptC [Nitrospiraceae bacterium]|nr:MAG: LPS export ABC transporter periplasmic protein LptC [Nitrospiraceae bacterium]
MINYRMTKRSSIIILSVFLAAVIFLILGYYKGEVTGLRPSFRTSSMQNLHLTHREDNQITWELSAREALFPTGSKEILLRSMGIRINRTPEIRLTGETAVYEVEKGEVAVNKSVEINIKDTTFTSDTLKWDSAKELLTTEDDVRFSGKNFLIEGTGLTASIEQQKVRILKNVKATFYLI